MLGRMLMSVRLLVVLAFLVGMPLLALPDVADWCEGHLYPPLAHRQRPAVVSRPLQMLIEPITQAIERPAAQFDQITRNVEPASFTHPFESRVHAAQIEHGAVTPLPAPPRDLLADRQEIAKLEAELQQLGATFYRLESPKAPNLPFQFIAQFERQVAGLPERFQLTTSDLDPLVAMRQMVEQVEGRTSVARP